MTPWKISQVSNIHIIFAHPDDEAMFFMPTIRELKRQNHNISWICMSTGILYYLFNV